MVDNSIYWLALPILGFILLLVKIISLAKGRSLSITLKGLGVELNIHSFEETQKQERTDTNGF